MTKTRCMNTYKALYVVSSLKKGFCQFKIEKNFTPGATATIAAGRIVQTGSQWLEKKIPLISILICAGFYNEQCDSTMSTLAIRYWSRFSFESWNHDKHNISIRTAALRNADGVRRYRSVSTQLLAWIGGFRFRQSCPLEALAPHKKNWLCNFGLRACEFDTWDEMNQESNWCWCR